jgi:hypothetical protein
MAGQALRNASERGGSTGLHAPARVGVLSGPKERVEPLPLMQELLGIVSESGAQGPADEWASLEACGQGVIHEPRESKREANVTRDWAVEADWLTEAHTPAADWPAGADWPTEVD